MLFSLNNQHVMPSRFGRGDGFVGGRGPPRPPPARPPGARPRREFEGMRPNFEGPGVMGSMGFPHPGMMGMQASLCLKIHLTVFDPATVWKYF